MKQLKKTLLTLALLLTAVTGAWAEDDVKLTSTEIVPPAAWNNDYSDLLPSDMPGLKADAITEEQAMAWADVPKTGMVALIYGYVDTGGWIEYNIINFYDGLVDYTNSESLSHGTVYYYANTGIRKYYYAAAAPSPSGPKVTWTAATKTGTFTMPGGNVELEPEYYPQAALTAAPTAINDVPATTDGAIVEAGTVANIPNITEALAQGTVMYYVSPSALDDAALLALAATDWTADVPTAESFTAAGTAYVYYYVRGNDGDTDETTFSDGDILAANALTVTIAAEPTYAVTFADDLAEPDKWTADPNAGVKKDQTVTVTYTGTKKVIGVKAEKKSAGPLAAAFKDGAKFKVGYQWNGGYTTYLEFTNSGGTYSLTSVSGINEENGFNSSTLTVKNGNVLALDVVCQPGGMSKMDIFSAQIEFDATSSTYKYSSKGSYFDGIISVTVNDADIISQLTPAN